MYASVIRTYSTYSYRVCVSSYDFALLYIIHTHRFHIDSINNVFHLYSVIRYVSEAFRLLNTIFGIINSIMCENVFYLRHICTRYANRCDTHFGVRSVQRDAVANRMAHANLKMKRTQTTTSMAMMRRNKQQEKSRANTATTIFSNQFFVRTQQTPSPADQIAHIIPMYLLRHIQFTATSLIYRSIHSLYAQCNLRLTYF